MSMTQKDGRVRETRSVSRDAWRYGYDARKLCTTLLSNTGNRYDRHKGCVVRQEGAYKAEALSERSVKSRGLKTKLIAVAVLLGTVLTGTLLMLQLDRRRTARRSSYEAAGARSVEGAGYYLAGSRFRRSRATAPLPAAVTARIMCTLLQLERVRHLWFANSIALRHTSRAPCCSP